MRNQFLPNFLLLILSTSLTLLVVEFGCRIYAYSQDQKTLEHLKEASHTKKNFEKVTLGQMFKRSANPKIIYEFLPNQSVTFEGKRVAINAKGFRGIDYKVEKEVGTKRILGLGDSQMFGWGVGDEETYLSVLSDRLNEQSEFSWEVINTAVPGYNSIMELETLKEKGLQYKPDYVILGFVGNDFALPNFIREKENYFSIRKSFLFNYVFKIKPNGLRYAPRNVNTVEFESRPSQVPPEYKDMVGKDAVVNALEELQELSLSNDFEVILFIDNVSPRLNTDEKLIKKTSDRLNFHFVSGYEIWADFIEKNNIENPRKARFLSDTDPHASMISHRATGEYFFWLMEKEFMKRNN